MNPHAEPQRTYQYSCTHCETRARPLREKTRRACMNLHIHDTLIGSSGAYLHSHYNNHRAINACLGGSLSRSLIIMSTTTYNAAARKDDLVQACLAEAARRQSEILSCREEDENTTSSRIESLREEDDKLQQQPDAYPVHDAEKEAAAARSLAEERAAQAEALAAAASKLIKEAEAAKEAALRANLDAEVKARAAHYTQRQPGESELVDVHNANDDGGNRALSDDGVNEAAAAAFLAKLSTTHEELRDVSELRADRNALGVEGARGLAFLLTGRGMTKLRALTLSCNALGDMGVATLSDAFNAASPLQHIDLSCNSLGDIGVLALAKALASGGVPRLARLSLKNNDVTDDGAAALGRVTHSALEWLNLSTNQIAERGSTALTNALVDGRFPSLRRLSLDHNRLDDSALSTFALALERGALSLDELYVDNNPASEEAARRVHAFFGGDEEDDDVRAAAKGAPRDARQVCESLSVSVYGSLSSGCIVQ